MRTVAIALVLGIAGYAVFDLFKGSTAGSLFGKPGTTASGVSIPGVPSYANVASPSSFQGTVTQAATLATGFAAAFGGDENQVSGDESDPSGLADSFGINFGTSGDSDDYLSGD